MIYGNGTAQAAEAKSFLHDLTCIAGLRSSNQRTNGPIAFSSSDSSAAYTVCDEVINRAFNDIDSAINKLSGVYVKEHLTKARAGDKYWTSKDIAIALVYLAECLNLYWDDLNATTYEVDAFKKTFFGKTVETYGRFASVAQQAQANAPTSSTPTSNAPKATRASRTPGATAKNPYKTSGPQSGNVRGLQGAAGVKVYANGNEVFKIIGSNSASKNIPTVFVRPLSPSGAAGATTNKIFVNSGNGYTDCACWFDDLSDANNFLVKVLNNSTIPAGISNLHVVKTKADPNGYFMIDTEYGICAIQASKLNEALAEAVIDEDLDEENGWEKVGARITNEEYEALTQSMLKY